MEASGGLLAKSCYNMLYKDPPPAIPRTNIWFNPIPSKVQFFIWTVNLGDSTIDNLIRSGLHLPNNCLLCYGYEKNMSHMLINFQFSPEILSAMLKMYNMNWITLKKPKKPPLWVKNEGFSKIGEELSGGLYWLLWCGLYGLKGITGRSTSMLNLASKCSLGPRILFYLGWAVVKVVLILMGIFGLMHRVV